MGGQLKEVHPNDQTVGNFQGNPLTAATKASKQTPEKIAGLFLCPVSRGVAANGRENSTVDCRDWEHSSSQGPGVKTEANYSTPLCFSGPLCKQGNYDIYLKGPVRIKWNSIRKEHSDLTTNLQNS